MFDVVLTAQAARQWSKLDGSVKKLLAQALKKRQENPFVPGSALSGQLAGCYKIKLRDAGVRLVYRPDGDKLIIVVISVGTRKGGVVYSKAQDLN